MAALDALIEAGLSGAEAKVYLALLDSGSATAGIVIKKAGLHRATTYQVLQRLQEKGLASSVIEDGRQHFEAASPERLLDVLREREEALIAELPKLKAMRTVEKQEVAVYRGVRGIRSALDAMLSEIGGGGQYFDFGVSGLLREVMGPYWYTFQARKRKLKVISCVIFNQELLQKNPQFFREYYGKARFHPKENASLTDTMIYNDTVMLLIWTAHPPIAVVIKNADNAKSYRNQFEMMWKAAKK